MDYDSQNELLSAYLDGELTPAERAEVEQLLAASPEARQLLEELRALSATLKSLPREKLGENLSENVLRIARQRISTESQPAESYVEPLSRTILRRMKNPRMWVWQAVIIAVVVLLVVYIPNQNFNQKGPPVDRAERNIAMANKPEEKAPSFRPSGMRAAPSIVNVDRKKEGAALSASGGTAIAPSQLSNALADKAAEGDDQTTNGMPTTSVGMAPSAPGNGMPTTSVGMAPSAPGSGMPTASEGVALESTANVGVAPGFADGRSPVAARESPAQDRADLAKKDVITLDEKFSTSNMPKSSAAEPVQPPAKEQLAEQVKTKAPSSDELLVVRCEIAPEAQKNHAFDKLLAANAIVLTDTASGGIAAYDLPSQETLKSLLEAKTDRISTYSDDLTTPLLTGDKLGAEKAGSMEVVYVEAPPDKIKATLNSLSAQSDIFKKVSVTASKDGSQLKWFGAYDTRRSEIAGPARGVQIKVMQAEKMAVDEYKSPPSGASSGVTSAVQGRAQRVPYSFGGRAGGNFEQPQATMAPTSPAMPARAGSAKAVEQELGQQKEGPQEADSSLGYFHAAPLGSTTSHQMQRVLFVLQVAEPKNYSESSKQSATADAVQAETAPAGTGGAKTSPAEAIPPKQ